MTEKNLIILCNAKSLKDYPFYNYNVDTVGMNIAYRFWHQIGWYPTYYISLDENVNLNYAKDIYFLILNRNQFGIKKFLLRKVFLKKYPQIKDIPEIRFLEDIIKKKKKPAVYGVRDIKTGSFAIRWGLSMGYQNIYILGVDGFVPLENVSDLIDQKGRLKETISPNPNKFFDGYEKKGDPLHISKKKGDKRNESHALTFKSIKKFIDKTGESRVMVASKSAKLLLDIFPYSDIPQSFLRLPDQHISFDWDEVISRILNDAPPKITEELSLIEVPKPMKKIESKDKKIETNQRPSIKKQIAKSTKRMDIKKLQDAYQKRKSLKK